MATLASRIVQSLGMVGDALVPHEDGAGFIADAALKVLSFRNMVEQEVEKIVGLFLVKADYSVVST